MQIARDLAGFTLGEADVLRKAIGKKIEALLHSQKEKFISGMIKNEISNDVAKRIWEWILPFASYGFNRSHSVAYGIIAYQTAYLKARYPVEFMSALLTSEKGDTERISFLIDTALPFSPSLFPAELWHVFAFLALRNNADKLITIAGIY